MSAVLAYLHSLAMIALATMLFVQILDIGEVSDRLVLQRFLAYCLGIATAATVLLFSGIGLVLWTERGAAFFLRNPVFYIKLALFAAMILIAVTPTRIIFHWTREADEGRIPEPVSIRVVKRYLIVELTLLLLIPLAAALSARGIGLQHSSS